MRDFRFKFSKKYKDIILLRNIMYSTWEWECMDYMSKYCGYHKNIFT